MVFGHCRMGYRRIFGGCFYGIVGDDAHEPGGKRPLAIKLVDALIDAQKRILHDFLSQPFVAGDQI